MESLFNNVTEMLKLAQFVSTFCTLKFLWHSGNAKCVVCCDHWNILNEIRW